MIIMMHQASQVIIKLLYKLLYQHSLKRTIREAQIPAALLKDRVVQASIDTSVYTMKKYQAGEIP